MLWGFVFTPPFKTTCVIQNNFILKKQKTKKLETPASPVMHLHFRGSLLSLVPDWILQSGPHGLKLTFDFTFCLFLFVCFPRPSLSLVFAFSFNAHTIFCRTSLTICLIQLSSSRRMLSFSLVLLYKRCYETLFSSFYLLARQGVSVTGFELLAFSWPLVSSFLLLSNSTSWKFLETLQFCLWTCPAPSCSLRTVCPLKWISRLRVEYSF